MSAPAIAFGPIPSRRLGRSLGVNHIPPKHCTYSCVYCQVGRTPHTAVSRQAFYPPEEVIAAVTRRVEECRAARAPIDYISFVPDGEPTLDVNLGAALRGVRELGIPVAVITNGSLLWRPSVRADLMAADLVSVEIDTVDDPVWRRVDRPHPALDLPTILRGILDFRREYRGTFVTQTMLVAGINDGPAALERVASYLGELRPDRAWLSVPTRPPADRGVAPPDDATVLRAYAAVASRFPGIELLTARESGSLAAAGEPVADLLAALAVHPMRQEAVEEYLRGAGEPLELVEELVQSGKLNRVEYGGAVFLAVSG